MDYGWIEMIAFQLLLFAVILLIIYFGVKIMAEVNSAKERVQALVVEQDKAFSDLEAEIRETKSANDSILSLLEAVKKRLDDALNSGNVTDRVLALKNFLDTENQRLADAVLANTEEQEEEEEEEVDPPSNDPTQEFQNGNPIHGTDDADQR